MNELGKPTEPTQLDGRDSMGKAPELAEVAAVAQSSQSPKRDKNLYQESINVLQGFFPDLQPEDVETKYNELLDQKAQLEAKMAQAKTPFIKSLFQSRQKKDAQREVTAEMIEQLADVLLQLERLDRASRLLNSTKQYRVDKAA